MKPRTFYQFYPWFCWLIAATIYFIQYGLLIFPATLSEQLQHSLTTDVLGIGVFSSAYLYTYVIMQVPAGFLLDRFGIRSVIFWSAVLMACGCLFMSFAHALWMGILGRMVMGMAGSVVFIGVLYVGRSWFSAALFPLVVGLTEATGGFSSLTLNSLFTFLQIFQSWQMILIECAAALFLLAFLVFLFVRDRRSIRSKQKIRVVKEFKSVLKNKILWLLGLYSGFQYAHIMVLANMWQIPYLELRYHLTPEYAVLENSLVIIGFTVGTIFIGFIARYFRDKQLILMAAFFQVILLVCVFYLKLDLWLISILLFLLGMVTGSIVLCFDVAKKITDESTQGVAAGFINMFFGAIGIPLLPLVGYLMENTGDNFYISFIPILLSSVIALVAAITLWLYKPRAHIVLN